MAGEEKYIGLRKIYNGLGKVVDSSLRLVSLPFTIVSYTTNGLVEGTEKLFKAGGDSLEDVGAISGNALRLITAAPRRLTDSLEKKVIKPFEKAATILLFGSFVSFTFSASATGSVIGAFNPVVGISTIIGIILLSGAFFLLQIKK